MTGSACPPLNAAIASRWARREERLCPPYRSLVPPSRPDHRHPEFSGWWETHDIKSVVVGQKVVNHPKKGVLRFEHASFQANDDPALKLVIYTPV